MGDGLLVEFGSLHNGLKDRLAAFPQGRKGPRFIGLHYATRVQSDESERDLPYA